MADITIKTYQPTPKVNPTLMAAAGAAVGAGARYILPTKAEMSSLLNKENVDTFVSSAARAARAESRSILKYGAVGALIASGIALVANALKAKKPEDEISNITYSKYAAILDSSPDACMYMYWNLDE